METTNQEISSVVSSVPVDAPVAVTKPVEVALTPNFKVVVHEIQEEDVRSYLDTIKNYRRKIEELEEVINLQRKQILSMEVTTMESNPVVADTTVPTVAGVPVTSNVSEAAKAKGPNLCRKCGAVIPPTGKRGRPATLCEKCKG